jgi:hypothetical protein
VSLVLYRSVDGVQRGPTRHPKDLATPLCDGFRFKKVAVPAVYCGVVLWGTTAILANSSSSRVLDPVFTPIACKSFPTVLHSIFRRVFVRSQAA